MEDRKNYNGSKTLKSYRPTSLLPSLSKILEKLILQKFLEDHPENT